MAETQLTIKLILPSGETYAEWQMTRTERDLTLDLLAENIEELTDHVLELFYGD